MPGTQVPGPSTAVSRCASVGSWDQKRRRYWSPDTFPCLLNKRRHCKWHLKFFTKYPLLVDVQKKLHVPIRRLSPDGLQGLFGSCCAMPTEKVRVQVGVSLLRQRLWAVLSELLQSLLCLLPELATQDPSRRFSYSGFIDPMKDLELDNPTVWRRADQSGLSNDCPALLGAGHC